MEDKLNYETPSLEELYICTVVHGGASQFDEDAEDTTTEYNEETDM